MKGRIKWVLPVCILALFTGCGAENKVEESVERMERTETGPEETLDDQTSGKQETEDQASGQQETEEAYSADTSISEVMSDPAFGDFGRLIFPVNSGYYSGTTLGDLRLTWYNNIDPDKTVEIANYLKDHAEAGDTVFFDIYSEEEKAADPAKEDTGLFFFLCGGHA